MSAPFHCALMKPAQERPKADLDATEFRDLDFPLINNWQAREVRTGAEAREGCTSRFRIRCAGWIHAASCRRGRNRAVEVGAGGVLTGLLRGVEPPIAGFKFGEPGDLECWDNMEERTRRA